MYTKMHQMSFLNKKFVYYLHKIYAAETLKDSNRDGEKLGENT